MNGGETEGAVVLVDVAGDGVAQGHTRAHRFHILARVVHDCRRPPLVKTHLYEREGRASKGRGKDGNHEERRGKMVVRRKEEISEENKRQQVAREKGAAHVIEE